MTFSSELLMKLGIFILGLCGFWVARHIFQHKKPENEPLVCPMNFDCEAVVHSHFSKFFGIPLEVFGMLYYGFTAFSYFLLVFEPFLVPPVMVGILILLSLSASLFSLYLIGVQIFAIKKGCFWCFISAFISIAILILTLLAYDLTPVAQLFS